MNLYLNMTDEQANRLRMCSDDQMQVIVHYSDMLCQGDRAEHAVPGMQDHAKHQCLMEWELLTHAEACTA